MIDLKVRVTGDSRDVQTAFVQAGSASKTFSATAQAAVAEVEARIKRMADKTSGINLIGTGGTQAVAATTAASLGRMEAAAVRLKAQIDPLAAAQMKLTSQLAEFDMMAQHGMLTTGQLTQAQGLARAEFRKSSEEIKKHGEAIGFNRTQIAMFTHSAKSLGEGLASGQNYSTMLMQQGMEFADALEMGEGGVMGSLTAIGSKLATVFTPGRLLVGGMTAAALGLGYAFMQVDHAIENTEKSLETAKKLMDGVRASYITNLPSKDAAVAPTQTDILANQDDLKKNRRDVELELRHQSTTLKSAYGDGVDMPGPMGVQGSGLADIIDQALKSRNFGAARDQIYQFAKDNNQSIDAKKAQDLITTLVELDKRISESGTALSTMSDATKTAAEGLKEVSDSMNRLQSSIPDLSAKLAYLNKIGNLSTAATTASANASPQQQKEIADDATRAARAVTDEYAKANGNKLLRDQLAPGTARSAVDDAHGDLVSGIAAANEEFRRMFPGAAVPSIKAGARRFDEQADAYRKDPTLARPGSSLYEKGAAVDIDVSGMNPVQRAFYEESLKKRQISSPGGKDGQYALEKAVADQKSEQFKTIYDLQRDSDINAKTLAARTSNLNLPGSQRTAADLKAQRLADLQRQNVPVDAATEASVGQSAAADAQAQSNFNYAELLKNSRMRIQSMDLERGGYALTAEAQAKLKIQTELYNEAERQNIDLTPAHKAAINDLADAYAKSETSLKKAAEAQAGLNQAWSGVQGLSTTFIDGMIDHTLNLRTALKAAIPVVLQLFNAMGKMQSTTGSFGINFGNPFGAPLGGAVSAGGGILSTLFGGLFGAKPAGAPVSLAPAVPAYGALYHSGGVVGEGSPSMRLLGSIPRYHTGLGIKSDEQLAVLQKGELVVPQANLADPMIRANVSPFGSQGAAGNMMSMVRGGDTINVNGDPDRRTMNTLRTMLDQRSQTDARETARNIGSINAKWKQNRGS